MQPNVLGRLPIRAAVAATLVITVTDGSQFMAAQPGPTLSPALTFEVASVLAREDGRLGPGMRRSDVDCGPVIAAARARAEAGERPALPVQGQRPACGAIGGPTGFIAGAVELSVLPGMLAGGLDRPAIDRTGLTGRFDIDFKSAPMRAAPNAPASDLPSVFTAVQEQLGLRLEPSTAPSPVLVIDRIQMPTED